MARTLEQIDADLAVVEAKLAIDRPDPETALPMREYTDEEVQSLRAAFDGLSQPEAYVQFRTVADSADYIRSACAKFGVSEYGDLPDSVKSGSLALYVRYAGPFPFGPADPLPGEELPG